MHSFPQLDGSDRTQLRRTCKRPMGEQGLSVVSAREDGMPQCARCHGCRHGVTRWQSQVRRGEMAPCRRSGAPQPSSDGLVVRSPDIGLPSARGAALRRHGLAITSDGGQSLQETISGFQSKSVRLGGGSAGALYDDARWMCWRGRRHGGRRVFWSRLRSGCSLGSCRHRDHHQDS